MEAEDNVFGRFLERFRALKQEPDGILFTEKLLYAVPDLPFAVDMHSNIPRWYNDRVNWLLDIAFPWGEPNSTEAPNVVLAAQRALFARMLIGQYAGRLADETRIRVLAFLAQGWPRILPECHQALRQASPPHLADIATWLYWQYLFFEDPQSREKEVPQDLFKAMLAWSMGHMVNLRAFPAAADCYREFLQSWSLTWIEDIAAKKTFGRLKVASDPGKFKPADFKPKSASEDAIIGRAALQYIGYLLRSSQMLLDSV